MTDPRESPLYDGPDEKFDLAKQMRIAVRNRRISARLTEERQSRDRMLPVWLVMAALAILISGITIMLHLVGHFR